MKKFIIVTIIAIFILSGLIYFFYSEIKKTTITTGIVETNKPKKIRTWEEIKKTEGTTNFKKTELENIEAFNNLAERTDEGISKSIKGFKAIYESKDSTAKQKAKALQKLANLYWRTGGKVKVAEEIFSGEYKKFLNSDNSVLLSNINLLKKAYSIYPSSRTAIEISFAYVLSGDYKKGEEWLKKYNSIREEDERVFTLYKEFLTYDLLAFKNQEKYSAKVVDLYKETLFKTNQANEDFKMRASKVQNLENFNDFEITLPFLKMFYAAFLAKTNSQDNQEEINLLVKEIINHIKSDPKPEKNEFLYFLNVQKDKKECDQICQISIKSLVKVSPEFKKFILDQGLSLDYIK